MESEPVPTVVEDCFGILKLYSDGSIYRSDERGNQTRPSIPDDGSAVWKDSLFDANNNLSLRLYKPKNLSLSVNKKLPIILYLRAGGFCFSSRTFHNNCISLCSGLPAMVVSPEYRLAPENKLPAAIDDNHSAVRWLRNQALLEGENRDEWFGDGVDFDRVFVFGDSSGGTMAHHLAIGLGAASPEILPVRIRGYVLMSPFFGGTKRTKSEKERPCEAFWSLEIYDRFFRLALPDGANADSPFVNPFGPLSPNLETVSFDPMLVLVGADEILRDRAEDYATRLKGFNKKIKYVEFEGKEHGFFGSNPFTEEAKDVVRVIKDFISENYS